MKKNIKNLVFKVIKQKAIDFSFLSQDEMFKYPVFEHYLTEIQEILIVYKYKSGSNLDEVNYIKLLEKKLKRKYNAYSVIFLGTKIEEITLSK